jgi:hypothetical protein
MDATDVGVRVSLPDPNKTPPDVAVQEGAEVYPVPEVYTPPPVPTYIVILFATAL